ncbi:MAG: hypothetical protein JXL97_02105 [Bacteroidales bacterium]|nr:hypothetical protein [Bacteroidales bacterium]
MVVKNKIIDDYLELILNLDQRAKIELISRISSSILEKKDTKQEQLLSCFGALISEQSADEIIESIYSARNFTDKNIEL